MNLLILDTETTGLAPSKGAKLIEIAALLYNVEDRVVLKTLASFFPCDSNPVEHINNIKPDWTNRATNPWAIQALTVMATEAHAYVAHNASFDKTFLETAIAPAHIFWLKPWICTKNDFKWPVPLPRNRLQDVCVAMGVPYVEAHRALTDCQFIVDCFNRVPDLQQRVEDALR